MSPHRTIVFLVTGGTITIIIILITPQLIIQPTVNMSRMQQLISRSSGSDIGLQRLRLQVSKETIDAALRGREHKRT